MNTKKILFALLLSLSLLSSCVSQQTTKPQEPNLVEQYITNGKAYEDQGQLQSALEQYELALTVDPKNLSALDHKKKVEAALYERARQHYEKGLALDEQGRYDVARREYLGALQNWPEFTQAKEKLSPGGVSLGSDDYVVHTLLEGQSVSKLSLIYYGDLKYYPVIGKFNNMSDVTRVRAGEQLKIPVLNGLTVEDLQKRHEAYMKERQSPREQHPRPSHPEAGASPKPTAPVAPAALPQESKSPDVPDTPTQTDAPPEVVKPPVPAVITPSETPKPDTVPAEESAPEPVAPPEPPSNYNQAMALFQQKKYSQAIPLFKKAQADTPDNDQIAANLFESYFQQGLAQFKKEQYLDAKQSFASAVEYDSACTQCRTYIKTCEDTYKEKHYNLGIHYFGKEQLGQAISEWEQVEKIDPGYKDVQSNLTKARTLYERLESIKQSTTK
nr:tetratricopeptide repeat protein [uncultured Desulfobacter sp.]